ncbi:MAG TPA: replicative DNA helicase [Candidatus Hypogeohydataceae bacterium YC41]
MAIELIEKLPPHSVEAEASLLGAMLLDNGVIDVILQYVNKDSFYKTAHRELFETIIELHEKGQGVDPLLLKEELKRKGTLEQVGELEYLMELEESVHAVANAEYYARLVRDISVKRGLIEAAIKIKKEAYNSKEDLDEILDKSERLIFELAQKRFNKETSHIADLISETFHILQKGEEGKLIGLSTGFKDLNDLTCGLQPSQLIVVAGRPSMGKTSFVLNIVEHVGVMEKVPVVFFSLEMSAQQLVQNVLCSSAKLNAHHVRKRCISRDEWTKLTAAASFITDAPIFIDDSPGLTIMELRAKARRLKAQKGIKLVAVDYLQLLDPPRAENRQQEVSIISRGLKALARELEVPVIAISQLNRAVEAREDHRPRMSDLRESGSIEQDADLVLLLHREGMYDPEKNPRLTEVIIAKQRNGPTDTVKLTFLTECMRFESATCDENL